jgi:holo-[acyl-carrier protein] synthase
MIFGIGTDIVSYPRMVKLNRQYGERFARRILADEEMAGYAASSDPARYLMKRFAAKEAFSKAMGTGLRGKVTLRRIRVEHDPQGKPLLVFDKSLGSYVEQMGIKYHHLSISDEKEMAVAFVVLEANE